MSSSPVRVHQFDGLAWVTVDNPPVNATSAAVRQGLDDAVDHVSRLPVRAAILRCAGRTFVAGGDITEFDKPPILPDLPDVIHRIETCNVPWIAAMHGSVFGGGLEIALGCAWRVALPGTRFALPEVTLGIVPGAGGTQRLPRLVGLDLALRMATTGTPVSAEAFFEAGAIDALCPDLEDATLLAAAQDLGPRPTPVRQRPVEPMPKTWWAGQRDAVQKAARGAIAPMEALALIAEAASRPFEEGQPKERARHLDLRVSVQSRALRHIFFAERAVARPPKPLPSERPCLTEIVLPGTDPLADRLAADIARAGLQISRDAPPRDTRSVVVLTGSSPPSDLGPVEGPALRAVDVSQSVGLPGSPTDVVLGFGSSKDQGVEIATGSEAPAIAVGAARALANRLRLAPVFTTPKDTLLTSRLVNALRHYRTRSGRSEAEITTNWAAFGGQTGLWLTNEVSADAIHRIVPVPEAAPDPCVEDAIAVLVNEGALALQNGCVAAAGAIDVLSVRACGFPRWRGGVMHFAETIGRRRVSDWMGDVMRNQPGDWTLSDMLRRGFS